MKRLHRVGRQHKLSACMEPQDLWAASTRTLASPWPASLRHTAPDAHGPHLLGQNLHFSKKKKKKKKNNSRWRVCSRTKSGPWKLYGEAVSLPSLQLKRDSKTSPLTPEIWAFPQHISHCTLLFISPCVYSSLSKVRTHKNRFPRMKAPDHGPLFLVFPTQTVLGRKLKLRNRLVCVCSAFPPVCLHTDDWALLGGQMVKNLFAIWKTGGSFPGLGLSPGEGHGNPLQCSCLENPMGKGAWRATVHGVAKESDATEQWTLYLFYCWVGLYHWIFKAMTLYLAFIIKTPTIYPISVMFCHCLNALMYVLSFT